jgi:DNA-binding transcriptional LysR family regulator
MCSVDQYAVLLLAQFQAAHPDLSVRLMFSDDIVDLWTTASTCVPIR